MAWYCQLGAIAWYSLNVCRGCKTHTLVKFEERSIWNKNTSTGWNTVYPLQFFGWRVSHLKDCSTSRLWKFVAGYLNDGTNPLKPKSRRGMRMVGESPLVEQWLPPPTPPQLSYEIEAFLDEGWFNPLGTGTLRFGQISSNLVMGILVILLIPWLSWVLSNCDQFGRL